MQTSQLASSLSEKPKGTLLSQPLVNPKNSNQAYEVQDPQINQCNAVHTLQSGKKGGQPGLPADQPGLPAEKTYPH